MSSITTQQAKLDLELVPKEKILEIGKCNRRLNPGKIQREPTFQVVLDALALTPCVTPHQGGNARRNEKGYHHNTMASIHRILYEIN
ncbi:hypothetical protein Tco_0761128, partial [Tanacetum coccineum]